MPHTCRKRRRESDRLGLNQNANEALWDGPGPGLRPGWLLSARSGARGRPLGSANPPPRHSPGSACGADRDLHDGAQVPHGALAAAVRGGVARLSALHTRDRAAVLWRFDAVDGASATPTAAHGHCWGGQSWRPPRGLRTAATGGGDAAVAAAIGGARTACRRHGIPAAASSRGGGCVQLPPWGGGRGCRRRHCGGAYRLLPPRCRRGRFLEGGRLRTAAPGAGGGAVVAAAGGARATYCRHRVTAAASSSLPIATLRGTAHHHVPLGTRRWRLPAPRIRMRRHPTFAGLPQMLVRTCGWVG